MKPEERDWIILWMMGNAYLFNLFSYISQTFLCGKLLLEHLLIVVGILISVAPCAGKEHANYLCFVVFCFDFGVFFFCFLASIDFGVVFS